MFLGFVLWGGLGYLMGSFPTAYVVARRMRGVDIRTFGSGNVGATNLGRLMGKKWAVFVTAVDMLKGALPVLAARFLGYPEGDIAVAAVAAVLGHNYPVWLNFKGGKGVATTYGTLFFACPWESMVAVPLSGLIWLAILGISGYVSLASLISLYGMVLLLPFTGTPAHWSFAAFLLASLSLWRHRSNLGRIIRGEERRSKKMKA